VYYHCRSVDKTSKEKSLIGLIIVLPVDYWVKGGYSVGCLMPVFAGFIMTELQ